jgi:hypothetical protein
MHFRIGRHFDVEPVAGFLADELDQVAGIAQFAGAAIAARQVAAQGHEAADVVRLELAQDRADRFARAADAGQVRRADLAFGLDLEHGVERALLGAAAGAEGHGKIFRLQLGQLLARDAQLFRALGRLGREKLDAEIRGFHLSSGVR